jgi:hypothetical protein
LLIRHPSQEQARVAARAAAVIMIKGSTHENWVVAQPRSRLHPAGLAQYGQISVVMGRLQSIAGFTIIAPRGASTWVFQERCSNSKDDRCPLKSELCSMFLPSDASRVTTLVDIRSNRLALEGNEMAC